MPMVVNELVQSVKERLCGLVEIVQRIRSLVFVKDVVVLYPSLVDQ